eukprot:328695-Chlamydomonas_euryale.AAC.1
MEGARSASQGLEHICPVRATDSGQAEALRLFPGPPLPEHHRKAQVRVTTRTSWAMAMLWGGRQAAHTRPTFWAKACSFRGTWGKEEQRRQSQASKRAVAFCRWHTACDHPSTRLSLLTCSSACSRFMLKSASEASAALLASATCGVPSRTSGMCGASVACYVWSVARAPLASARCQETRKAQHNPTWLCNWFAGSKGPYIAKARFPPKHSHTPHEAKARPSKHS